MLFTLAHKIGYYEKGKTVIGNKKNNIGHASIKICNNFIFVIRMHFIK